MKHILLFVLGISLFISNFSHAQTNLQLTLEHDGVTRDYRLHLPPQYSPGTSLPLVFNLHGNTSNGVQQELYTAFIPLADTEGFILCHPDGLAIPGGSGNTWNVSFPGGADTDDAGFLSALIDELHTEYDVDLSRVYSTGMSNGGYMSYKMACEFTDRIAAIASVTGSMVPIEVTNCNPSRTIPVMQIHGTTDPVVPYDGAAWSTGIESLMEWWATHNGCSTTPSVTDIPDSNTTDGSTVELYEYTSCNDDVDVQLYKITNGGHTWPSGVIDLPGSGNTNKDINATQIIWDFFSQYQLPGTSSLDNITDEVDVAIFPNPVKGNLTVKVDDLEIEEISIYNLLGQEVIRKNIVENTSTKEISLAQLNKGTYIIKIKTEDGFITEKIIKE